MLKYIESKMSFTDTERVGFNMEAEFFIDALYGKVDHKYKLDHNFLYSEFQQSLCHAFKANKFSDPNCILSEFKKRCEERLRIKNKYILLTSISLKSIYLPKRRKINGCVINFSKSIPFKYRKFRLKQITQHEGLELSEQKDFLFVTISVIAPDVNTAFKNAIESLDIIRAIWQLCFKNDLNFLATTNHQRYSTDTKII